MSDVEDYAYSPYDDLEDILYDADPAPELADDLADHAIHSPIYHDEDAVKNELQDYFSDWEYYSDDYMDDDPSLLRTNPQDGSPLKRGSRSKQSVQRGKKRKLVATQDIPPLDLDEDQLLIRCIKGTVWADSSGVKIPHYKHGQEKKVALMKDWKRVFALKNNGWGRSAAEEDESWANDMSLADMGLQNLPRQASFGQDNHEEGPAVDEDEDELEDMAEDAVGDLTLTENMHGARPSKLRNAALLEEDDGGGGSSSSVVPTKDNTDDEEGPRKRRRAKPALPSPPDSNEAAIVDAAVEQRGVSPETKHPALSKPITFMANGAAMAQAGAQAAPSPDVPQSKKRKAADDPEEAGTASSTSGRAKRVASTAAKSSNSHLKVTRSTRSTKTK